MIQDIKNDSRTTVTSWNGPALYAKKNRDILAIGLQALRLCIINPYAIKTWEEEVDGRVIRYSMSYLDILKNFSWVLFDKIVNKNKTLPDSTPLSEEKTTGAEEDPLAYLLLLPDSPSDNNLPKTPVIQQNENQDFFGLYDFYSTDLEESNAPPKQTTNNSRIESSEEGFLNALAYLDDSSASGPVDPKERKGNEAADLLKLLSL